MTTVTPVANLPSACLKTALLSTLELIFFRRYHKKSLCRDFAASTVPLGAIEKRRSTGLADPHKKTGEAGASRRSLTHSGAKLNLETAYRLGGFSLSLSFSFSFGGFSFERSGCGRSAGFAAGRSAGRSSAGRSAGRAAGRSAGAGRSVGRSAGRLLGCAFAGRSAGRSAGLSAGRLLGCAFGAGRSAGRLAGCVVFGCVTGRSAGRSAGRFVGCAVVGRSAGRFPGCVGVWLRHRAISRAIRWTVPRLRRIRLRTGRCLGRLGRSFGCG